MRTLFAPALLLAADGKDDRAELKKFEGTWQLVSEVMHGKEQPADYLKRIRWTFDDNGHWKVEDGGKVIFTGDMTVYPDRDPKAADSTRGPPPLPRCGFRQAPGQADRPAGADEAARGAERSEAFVAGIADARTPSDRLTSSATPGQL